MRTIPWNRIGLSGLLGGATVCAAVAFAGEQPPPYPSMSPVLPAALPPTPVIPGTDVKPAAAQVPVTAPLPTIPKLSLPYIESAKPALVVPAVTSPEVLPIPSPATRGTQASLSDYYVPNVAATKPAVVPTPTLVQAETKPVAAKSASGSVNISIGATPGVLDNTGKFDAMVVDAKTAYAKVHDYSCHFIKQERVKGRLTAEVIYELHVRTKPFSIYTKAVQPKEAAGAEMAFVTGRFATNQVRLKPNGGTFATVSVDDPRAATGRHPADQVGLGSVLASVEKQVGTERKLNHPMVVTVGEFAYAGKPVVRYELVCEKPHAHRASQRTVLFVDKETKLPVRFEAYDEPRGASGPGGDLLESYSFVNLKLNVGHATAVFER